jgi:hypothetical protein
VVRIAFTACVVVALAAPAMVHARATALVPGVTYSHTTQATAHGPVSLHVVAAPRPGGLYAFQPVLSNDTIVRRETVSSMQRRLAATSTSVGINGDLFTWAQGVPTGLLVQSGVLQHHSHPGRASVGVDATGTLRVDRVSFSGAWRVGEGLAHPITHLNDTGESGLSLFTPAWGATTPTTRASTEVVLAPFPPARAGADLVGVVASISFGAGGGTPIPRDGAVLVARGGAAAAALRTEATIGAQVTVRLTLRPATWLAVSEALGGGPMLVRDGVAITRWSEHFTADQLFGRHPRAAVGQRRDGSLVLVAVDGRQPWFSIGMTNLDLARTLVRLGCVTGSAVDAGGSVTIAFDGKVLNRPSDSSGERPVADALLITYAGVYAPPVAPVLSPDGDGWAEEERFAYKLVRPSTVAVRLIAPDGAVRDVDVDPAAREPGVYELAWPGRTSEGVLEPEGRWRWRVEAADDLGRLSSMDRQFSLNTTLGFTSAPKRARRGKPVTISFTLARAASIRVTIEKTSGEIYRTVASGRRNVGRVTVRWDGRDGRRKRLAKGFYAIRVSAANEVGVTQQRLPLAIR